jgi:hypothetical protein
MIDKDHLRDKQVLFKLAGIPVIYAGVVRYVEGDGLWVEAPSLIGEMLRDAAWKSLAEKIQVPILFVPTASLVYLIAAKE